MNSKFLLVAAAAVLVSGGAHAADLMIETVPVLDAPPADHSVYVQLLGGGALGSAIEVVIPPSSVEVDLATGYALAGTIGVVVMDGLSVEADVFSTRRDFDGPNDTFSTTSLMANVKYTAALNDMFSIYGAAGVGQIWAEHFYHDAPPEGFYYSGLGFQLIAGASANLTDNIAAVAEVRYQDSFEPLQWEFGEDDTRDASVVAVMAGLKFGF